MRHRALPAQTQFPRHEADGITHVRDCECARCEEGFRPSESQRQHAAAQWSELRAREKAQAALLAKHERKRVKALRLELELQQEWKRTRAYLDEQAALLCRLAQDRRLDAMLAARKAGKPVGEALAAAEVPLRPTGTG